MFVQNKSRRFSLVGPKDPDQSESSEKFYSAAVFCLSPTYFNVFSFKPQGQLGDVVLEEGVVIKAAQLT